MKYSNLVAEENTKATEFIPGRKEDMKKNLAGGVSFKASDFTALRRWLLTGSFSNFFYENSRKNTNNNVDTLLKCIKADPEKVAAEIVYASNSGTMASQHTCILALVHLSNGEEIAKEQFRGIFNNVVRTASHLYEFVSYTKAIRGMGKTIHKAIKGWIEAKSTKELEYQFLKYQQREGFANRDILRLFKPVPRNELESNLFSWVVGKAEEINPELSRISIYENMKAGNVSKTDVVKSIADYGLTHEMIPANIERDKKVWTALFYKAPIMATVRNLATYTRNGVFEGKKGMENLDVLESKLSKDNLQRSRIHPLEIASAQKVYSSGGTMGRSRSSEFVPVPRVNDILEKAVHDSFKVQEPTGKHFFHALDISGSMAWMDMPGLMLKPFEIETIMALVSVNTEKNYFVGGFSDDFIPLPEVSKGAKLQNTINKMQSHGFGGTDAASAYKYSIKNNIYTDVFVFWTDNMNWGGAYGGGQPSTWLKKYRKSINPEAKAIYVTLVPYGDNVTLADPKDPMSYDIAGFSSQTPKIISMIAEGLI